MFKWIKPGDEQGLRGKTLDAGPSRIDRGDEVMVDSLTPVARTLRTFGWLVLIGFLAMIFVGPVLVLLTAMVSLAVTVFSFFLPFAIIGLLVWVPYHVLTHGGEATWRRTRELAQGFAHSTLAMPFRVCAGTWSRACTAGRAVREFNLQALRFIGVLLLEGVSGALVGGLLGLLVVPDPPRQEGLIFLFAAAGAGVGTLTAIARFRPPRGDEAAAGEESGPV